MSDPSDSLTVECPKCFAAPGKWCIAPPGAKWSVCGRRTDRAEVAKITAERDALAARLEKVEQSLAAACERADDYEGELAEVRTDLAAAIARAETILGDRDLAIRRIAELTERAEQAERELERWRHGVTIEGDFVCPNELRAVNAETELRALRAAMPTAEEREALVELADEVRSLFREQPQAELAVAAIDKIVKVQP